MNTRIPAVVLLAATTLAGGAQAHGVRYTTARVIAVEPAYETVVVERPVTTCHREIVERRVRHEPSAAGPTLAGAIVGAAIGRQFGDGRGRDALTLIGAAAGSAVANDRARRRNAGAATVTVVREPVERCSTTYRRETRRQLTGYWVDYRHRGRLYRVLMPERPGRHIRIATRS